MKNAPKKIYLQIPDDCEPDDYFDELSEVTWHSERIGKNDIEYIKNKP